MYQLKLFKIKIKYQHLFTFFIYNLIMLHVLFLFHLVINNLIKLCVLAACFAANIECHRKGLSKGVVHLMRFWYVNVPTSMQLCMYSTRRACSHLSFIQIIKEERVLFYTPSSQSRFKEFNHSFKFVACLYAKTQHKPASNSRDFLHFGIMIFFLSL